VTDRGQRLMRLYSDLDLVAAEALRTGVFDELPTSAVAAALSVLVFEARRPDDEAPRAPGGAARRAIDELGRLAGRVQNLEKQHRLDFTRQPDLGFAWATYRWAEGDDLDEVLVGTDLAAGDFVRWMKQVIDLAGQVADAAGDSPVRRVARDVVKVLRRGVVAYSAVAD
jgi:ATP-dependent RNA helicase HelY